MKGLPFSTWLLLLGTTVPWVVLAAVFVRKVKRVDRERDAQEEGQR